MLLTAELLSIVLCYVQTKSFLALVRRFPRVIDFAGHVTFRRYTGEGMDIMEFSEAENNTRDLM